MNKIIPRRSDLINPLHNLMEDFVDRFLNDDDVFASPVKLLEGMGHKAYPKINVLRRGDNLVIEAGLPGISKKDVKVHFESNMLWISGKMEQANNTQEDDYFYKELSAASFSRGIQLPADVTQEHFDKAKAKLDNGILRIEIPYKGPEPKTKIKELPIEDAEVK